MKKVGVVTACLGFFVALVLLAGCGSSTSTETTTSEEGAAVTPSVTVTGDSQYNL